MNSTFRDWLVRRWLAKYYLRAVEDKMAFVAIFSQIELLFGPPIIKLVWYRLKQLLIIHLSVGESGGYLPRRFAAQQISTTIHFHFGE